MGPNRRVIALRTFVIGLAALAALPATALGASTASIATSLDPVSELDVTKVLVDSGPENNHLTVALAADTFTISDSAGTAAGPGCTQAGANVTCPAIVAGTRVEHTEINTGAGDDTVMGSPIADIIDTGPGTDVINSSRGGIDNDPNSPTYCLNSLDSAACRDSSDGGQGFDTATFADRTLPIAIDLRPGHGSLDDDGTAEGINAIESIIGGLASDEIVGGLFNDLLNGGPGNAPDTICGALGKDTVDYSDKTAPVTVDLQGQLATDPDIVDPNYNIIVSARQDCRPVIKIPGGGFGSGLPCTSGSPDPTNSCFDWPKRDCTNNDGVAGEGDCVGDDIENIIGGSGNDVLIGNDPDPLYGRSPSVEPIGENVLTGGGGDDLLTGALGPDMFVGGSGHDTVSYEGRGEAVKASIDGAANDGSSLDLNARNNQSDQILGGIENIIGGNGDDVLKGDGNANVLIGGPGHDLLQGHAGGDTLAGSDGVDRLEGGVDGDALDGGPGDDSLKGGFGNDAIDGGDGTDTASWSDATTPVTVIPNGFADDGTQFEGDNVGGTVESLIGGLDNDTLVGNGGNGKIEGGGGDDLLDGGFGSDLIIGGTGNDTAGYGDRTSPVNVNLAVPGGDGEVDENDDIAGDVEGIAGSRGNDVLAGNGALNLINGGPGDDRISGAEGDDFLAGDLGNDVLNGDEGNDTLDGAEGDDTMNGAGGNDTLKGFLGTDVLDGGLGSDTMSGGDSVDTVSYASRSGDVTVDTLGTPNDGEKGENDLVRTDVESVRTGSGDDTIDISDGAAGVATCGAGTDSVTADALDEIGSGCEAGRIKQAALCVATSRTVKVKGGVIPVRLSCAFNAKGTLRLESRSKVKAGKGKARKLVLGSKSFTGKRNQITTVKVKASKAALKVLRRKGRLSVRSQLRVRKDAANAAMRTTKTTFTVKASKK